MEQNHGGEELDSTPENGERLRVNSIVIPADENSLLRRDRLLVTDIRDYQRVVGGSVQALNLEQPAAGLYCNEDGKLLNLPVNGRATLLWWMHSKRFRFHDAIVGDALLVGELDERGLDSDVPGELATLLLEATNMRVEIQIRGDEYWLKNQRRFHSWANAYAYALKQVYRSSSIADVRVVPVT
jgi:hypothetical protein